MVERSPALAQRASRSVVRMLRGVHAAFLPLAITFGALALVFLVLGQPVWVAFLPMAITFAALTFTGGASDDDEEPSAEDA